MVAVQSCRPDDPDPEIKIETGEIEEMGPTHCIIHGEMLEIGLDGISQHGFLWSESSGASLETGSANQLGTAFAPGTFSSTIKDLSPNTTYYIKAYASSGSQTKYGTEKTVSTTAPTVPVLQTLGAYSVESYSAGSGGDITSDGGAAKSKRGVCWDTGRNPNINDQCTDEGWRGYEEGGMLKQTGTELWVEPNLMATNETGFTAIPSGFRDVDGLFRANVPLLPSGPPQDTRKEPG